jgi:transcriptional regulator
MYIPGRFAENDLATLHDVIRAHAFAALVTVQDGLPVASHIPFVLDGDRGPHGSLLGHLARANPQWRSFADPSAPQALVIFEGPHAYVSPSWYAGAPNVPTWNYVIVHAYGTPRIIIEPGQVRSAIDRLVAVYESGRAQPWSTTGVPPDFIDRMLSAIVAFEIPIERLEGKFKLSQNKTADDRAGVITALSEEPDNLARAVAELMRCREA